jgi:parallel beta-helix repeat protein
MLDRPVERAQRIFKTLHRTGKKASQRNQRAARSRRPVLEALDRRALLSTIYVNSTADTNPAVRSNTGVLTLREAILLADGSPSLPYASLTESEKAQMTGPPGATVPNTIAFKIGSSDQFILVGGTGLGPLPPITRPTILDATPPQLPGGKVMPGFASQVINLRASSQLGGNSDGLTVIGGSRQAGGGSVIRGFDINGFRAGIVLDGDPANFLLGNNTVEGNFIGVDSGGRVGPRLPQNTGDGIFVEDSPRDTIGAATNLPPALAAGRGNILSNNQGDGVEVITENSPIAANCTIVGNFIGTTGSGTAAQGNGIDGVEIEDATDNLVKNNTISGNTKSGVQIAGGSANTVEANFIGTNRSGRKALANQLDGVTITRGSATIQNNLLSGNTINGVTLTGTASGVVITGNSIGTDPSGSFAIGNGGDGVSVSQRATNSEITGNLISGNQGNGVELNGDALIIGGPLNGLVLGGQVDNIVLQGNYIGTNRRGTTSTGTNNQTLGNTGDGVLITDAVRNLIGGNQTGLGNLISGNGTNGIMLSGSDAQRNMVQGNFVGTDASGTVALMNFRNGVLLADDASNNMIGGSGPIGGGLPALEGEANLISGNGLSGVAIEGPMTMMNYVGANFIGTQSSGTQPLGNGQRETGTGQGVLITGAPQNTIAVNLISGNPKAGVQITGATATGNVLYGNLIGTDQTGMEDLANGTAGVLVDGAPGNSIGSTASALPNVISGNKGDGVSIQGAGATMNLVQADDIGTDATGSVELGNGGNGVAVSGAPGNTIGGAAGANPAGDVISGNVKNGVFITGPGATGNRVVNDRIGTAADGSTGLANLGAGVTIAQGSTGNQIVTSVLAFNSGAGVRDLNPAPSNLFSRNSIDSNARMGIDIAAAGPTLAGVPTFLSAVVGATQTTVTGFLESAPNTTYTIEFFANPMRDPSGYGQGKTYLGSTAVTTDANGERDFRVSFGLAVPAGQFISATATDPRNNTTEFSKDVTVVQRVGQLPSAGNDLYTTAENTTLRVAASTGVLANDTDPNDLPLTPVLAQGPADGQLTLNPDGSFTYIPNLDDNGTDSFTYRDSDGLAQSNLATVTLIVTPVNQPPVANPLTVSATEDTPLVIPVSQLLSSDTPGPPNESNQTLTLIAVGGAVNGAVGLSAGTITFTPAVHFTGTASFSYTIQDNGTTNGQPDPKTATATVTVNVEAPVVVATSTTIASDSPTSVFGQLVTFTATVAPVAPGGGTPTGMVAFKSMSPDGTIVVTLGTVPLDATGTAVFSMDQLVPTNHTIFAVYLGDASNAPSTSATITQVVQPADTMTTLSAASSTVVLGQANTLSESLAVVPPGAAIAAFTGTITIDDTFQGTTTVVGVFTIGQSGSFPALTGIGIHSLTAVYSGDSNYSGSTSAPITVDIQPADTTITLSAASTTVASGQANTLTESLAVVPPGSAIVPFTGTITIYDTFEGSTTTLGVFTIGQSGTFPALIAVGTHILTAAYSGDDSYNGSTSAPITVVVVPST